MAVRGLNSFIISSAFIFFMFVKSLTVGLGIKAYSNEVKCLGHIAGDEKTLGITRKHRNRKNCKVK